MSDGEMQDFGALYQTALTSHLRRSDESGVDEAYELGRQALGAGLSLGDIAELHHRAMVGELSRSSPVEGLARSESFFLEVSSVYDMALRGFREMIVRLQSEIQERRKIEQELREASAELARERDHLEERVAERTKELEDRARELSQANVELERSNSDLSDFAHIASHDMREPLRAICNHVALLADDQTDLDARAARRLDRIRDLTRRMEQMVANLLAYARMSRAEETREIVAPAEILADIRLGLEEFLEQANARIEFPEDLPKIHAPASCVRLVFQNLIVNGVKYNNSEEKIIRISHSPKFSTETTHVFCVADNGIGVNQENLRDIFRMFKRLNADDKYGHGSGYGLNFVKKSVENCGGRIWIESKENVGSEFFFSFPKF